MIAGSADLANARRYGRSVDTWLRFRARTNGLTVRTSTTWTSDHDRALEIIGPPASMSIGEVRLLAQPRDRAKIHIIAEDNSGPVAVVTLRNRQTHWEPVTSAVVVGGPVGPRRGSAEVFAFVDHDIVLPEVFETPFDHPRGRHEPFAVHGTRLDGTHEDYWRSSKAWKDVRSTRSKTEAVEVTVGDPAAISWTIDRWAATWEGHPNDETSAAADMAALWPDRLRTGRLFVVSLSHRGEIVAANVNEVADGVLYGLITARDTSWRRGSLGTRLIDATFEQATSAGLRRIDLGGYSDYKHRFAPVCDVRHTVRYDRIRPRQQLGRVRRRLLGS